MAEDFGQQLKRARLDAGFRTQNEATKELARAGLRVSQSLIAQYENDRVADPNPAVLSAMAAIYGGDYLAWVLHFAQKKYEPAGGWDELDVARWKLIVSGLTRFESVGDIEGLEIDQLRAKTQFLVDVQLLDLKGIVKWSAAFPSLEELWLILPNFVDDINEEARAEVVRNANRDVKVVYFVHEKDLAIGSRFWTVQRALDNAIESDEARRNIVTVGLKDEHLTWLHSDYVVANPSRRAEAVGFQYIRRRHVPTFGVRMDDFALAELVQQVRPWVIEASSDYVLHVLKAESSRPGG